MSDALPVGRELDAAVAEHVMGWRYSRSKHGHYIVITPDGEAREPAFGARRFDAWTGQKEPEPQWWDDLHELPYYSTEVSDAWQIVEKLTTTTKQWFRCEQSSVTYEATFSISGAGDADRECSASGDSMAEAICRAALLTVGEAS